MRTRTVHPSPGASLPRVLLLVLLVGAACGGPEEGPEANAPSAPGEDASMDVGSLATVSATSLRVSERTDRSSARTLDGSTVRGKVALFFEPGSGRGVSRVDFYLDDPTRARAPAMRDTSAPYDFAGTASNGSATLYDTTQLRDGGHGLTVAVTYTNGRTDTATARFTVANAADAGAAPVADAGGPAPTPTPTPTPDAGTTVPPGTPLPTPSGLRSVADWEKLFVGYWDSEHQQSFLPQSTSLDSWQYYGLAYGIDGNTAMYRATGNTKYLDRALLYVNNVVNNAKLSSSLSGSQFKDGYLGWASQRSDTLGQEVPLFESYCWRYVTRLLRTIRETPALYDNATYRTQYDKLLAFTEKNMFEKWYRRGVNSYLYRVNTHMASHWAFIAMDLSLMTTDATRKSQYLAVFNDINRHLPNYNNASLRGQMINHPLDASGYFWSDTWGSFARPGQDVAHANGVLAFIVEARDAGMEWTDQDVRRFVVTMNKAIWPGAGKYAEYVDGSGTGTGWFNDGLMKLGRYDTELQRRLESHTVGNNTQFYGNAALNVRKLSEAAAAGQ